MVEKYIVIDKGIIIHINNNSTEGDTKKNGILCFVLVEAKPATSFII